ncbi:hypothetical protein PUR49_05370 [Streptomyces sp. BE147]|uniref:hypothetical protein n=1 Tax=Streptomyces sp. BE147 TaxID=3002524 RepID=UPI002E782A91|nr:hypothetical protein [Streptomyces sp. BE147]MEE1735944.1 hypothetical protein [Streptomyces sp. BE147]
MPDTTTPAVWSDDDPLMHATAAAVWEQCHTENTIVVDDPRTIAAVAATVARQLLDTTSEDTATVPSIAATLATPCDACDHTLNWHRNDVGCTVPRCVCGRFQDAVEPTAAPPAPADRAAVLNELEARYRGHARDSVHPNFRAAYAAVANDLSRLAGEAAAGAHHPTTNPLADCATEYRVPVPEHGGAELLVRRQALAHGTGWAVSTMARGGGRAWTTEGWQDSISALSVDRLFCWPDPATAVDAARRALATPAVPAAPEETR